MITKKEIAKDFFFKTVAPACIALLLFSMFKNVFTKDGVTDYLMVWIMCGIPFGIRRMYLWLLPHSRASFQFTIAIWAINFIVGGLIGGVILVWRLLVAVWYLILTVYRIVTFKNQVPVDIDALMGRGVSK